MTMVTSSAQKLAMQQRIRSTTGDVTLVLASGVTLTGEATLDGPSEVVTIVVGAVRWTVPLSSIEAVGGAAS